MGDENRFIGERGAQYLLSLIKRKLKADGDPLQAEIH